MCLVVFDKVMFSGWSIMVYNVSVIRISEFEPECESEDSFNVALIYFVLNQEWFIISGVFEIFEIFDWNIWLSIWLSIWFR